MPNTTLAMAPMICATMRPMNEIQTLRTLSFFLGLPDESSAPSRP